MEHQSDRGKLRVFKVGLNLLQCGWGDKRFSVRRQAEDLKIKAGAEVCTLVYSNFHVVRRENQSWPK